jgi:hypothetical protein
MARFGTPQRNALRRTVPTFLLAVAIAAPAAAAVKKMFVTSVFGSTNLSTWPQAQGQSGLAAGDAICQTLAHDGAGLPSWQDFRAWLSTSTEDAYCRVAGFDGQKATNCGELGLPDAGPWQRMDGRPFANSLSELTSDLALLHPPAVDETGELVTGSSLLTGTHATGAAYAGGDCSGWTAGGGNGRQGLTAAGGSWWTSSGLASCAGGGRLLCFESGSGDALPAWEGPGLLAFVTSLTGSGELGSWPEAGAAVGVAAGDAICQSLATTAGLAAPQSFVAWLSTASVDAVDRLSADGPWKRLDGVEIAANRAALLTASPFLQTLPSALVVNEDGTYVGQNAYTGSTSLGRATLEDCNGWTSASAGTDATYGSVQDTRGYWTTSASQLVACSSPYRLYCFSNLGGIFRDGFESGDRARWSASVP